MAHSLIEYPNGQFYYCSQDYFISIKGDDGIVYPRGDGKKKYGSTEIANTCFHLHKLYNDTSTTQCTIDHVIDKQYILLYKNGGCSVGIHFNDDTTTNNLQTVHHELSNYLNTHLSQNKYEHAYFIDTNNIITDYPLGTSHLCYDNNHIAITGYDNIIYGDRVDSKSAYSFSNIEDSCYHSLLYFNTLNNKKCNINELTTRPLRSYGHCFVSSNYINISISQDYRDYLHNIGCHGCKYGEYYFIQNNSSSNHYNYIIFIISILISIYLLLIN